ncbi:hypothetical protein KAI92_04525 [Candidatus Parcubacteria bacterium]|nr:hypothetical protein [Candidatus Parcubacteria bacterium]
MSDNSTFLFARPSFIEGVSRVMDLGGTMQVYNNSKTENEADFKALKKDWEIVGKDIFDAINKYGQKK